MTKGKKPYILGVSGGSGSGKTTLLAELTAHFPGDTVTLISQDNYYISRDDLPRDLHGAVNFDHPSAVDMDALALDVARLIRGEAVDVEEYTFNNPAITPKTITYRPAPIIIVEGLFTFSHTGLNKLLDLKVFVETSEHLRLSRRIRRDAEERGYGLDQVLEYYERFVVPMYRRHIEPHKEHCDLIIPNNFHMGNAISVLLNHLEKVAGA